MLNVKNHHTYSDKFVLSVVDLNNIELATEEDEACGLVHWARLFKAQTWEELKMLAKENEYLQAAAESIYIANADDIIRQQCRARQEAERHERTVQRDMKRLNERIAKLEAKKSELQTDIAKLSANNAELTADNAELVADNVELKKNIANLEAQVLQMQTAFAKLQKRLNLNEN